MRILFFCGDRKYSTKVLKDILKANIELIAVVSVEDNQAIHDLCRKNHINFVSTNKLNDFIDKSQEEIKKTDFLISYLYPMIIPEFIIDLFGDNSINFHPSPLPEHRGVAGCSFSLLLDYDYWGVTAHQLIREVDAGDIIKKIIFPIDKASMFATDVEKITQEKLYELFQIVFDKLNKGVPLMKEPQKKLTDPFTRKKLQRIKEFSFEDDSKTIDKKIKALWLPPFDGLTLTIDNENYTLINREILVELEKLYKKLN